MSLRHALLALLRVSPLTGYDLQKQFSVSVGHVWHAPDSQIYPELRKMEAEGLIEGEVLPWGTKGKKRQYRVTAKGDQFFVDWMNEPLVYARVRDPAHLRAAYLESASTAAAREFFQGHIAHHTEQLGIWEDELEAIDTVSNPMLRRRLAVTAAAERRKTVAFKRFTYEGLIEQAKGEIAWAQRGLRLLEELDAD
ncbi:helix-turn-helix transcriptional regulator [Parafrigoribacterium mesophilum]|uniref:PadR family transcriptional regulator n=1 Tax=Parafrigoribacterium mesophilum TaxID=433646 RepID=UPI0031FD00E4